MNRYMPGHAKRGLAEIQDIAKIAPAAFMTEMDARSKRSPKGQWKAWRELRLWCQAYAQLSDLPKFAAMLAAIEAHLPPEQKKRRRT